MTFKKAVGKIHLWLGLASGLVVFIVAVTGCIYVFQKEISEALHPAVFFVPVPESPATLPLSTLRQNAQAALGADKPLNFIITHRQPDRAWEFSAYHEGDADGWSYFASLDYYQVARINPYTGKVTGVTDYKYEFFNVVKSLHWSLLLNTAYGQPIVGSATLIFVLMLISGLILWWPKKWNKANRDKSFKVKWKAKFKRVNYDLHNVSGFYALLFTMVIACTGLVWAFRWFQGLVYVAAALSMAAPEQVPVRSADRQLQQVQPLDLAFSAAQRMFPDAVRIGVSVPLDTAATIYASGYRGKETYYNYDELQFDQYSGRLLQRRNYSEKNRGEKLIGMNYDIHVGAIGGLPGKMIAFICSLVAAALPVTGFLIWWGRKFKKKPAAAKPV